MTSTDLPKPSNGVSSWANPLQIESSEDADGTVLLTIHGELDVDSAQALQGKLAEVASRHPARIVLELSNLEFIDSSGIGVLVKEHLQATREGRVLVLRNVPHQTARIFDIAGLSSRFTISQDALS